MSGSARITPATRRGLVLFSSVVAGVGAMCALAVVWGMFTQLSDPAYGGKSLNTDFSVFWAAARLGWAGEWTAAFDYPTLTRLRELPPEYAESRMYWLYPPTFHLVLAPLGALDFATAWAVFSGGSLALMGWALWPLARGVPGAWALVMGSPVAWVCFVTGQNTALLAALFLTALSALERRRWLVAGLCFAGMTIKPQLGLMIPIALAAAGHWRVIGWAGLGTLAMVGVTLVVPGPAYWPAMLAAQGDISAALGAGQFAEALMIGWYTSLSHLGLDRGLALWMQGGATLACAVAVAWTWARPVDPSLKAAVLCFCLPMATPYAHYYEWMFPVLGAMFLARAGLMATRAQRLVLLGLWAAPIAGFALSPSPGFPVLVPLMLVGLGAALMAARDAPGRRAGLTAA